MGITGIPNKNKFGDPSDVPVDELIDWFIQKHVAQRAGEHYDYRFGTPNTGLYSFASKKEMPKPGERSRAWFQQPIHSHAYGSFQGNIGKGYGAGQVRRKDMGKILVTSSRPGHINFTLAHKRFPERFTLVQDKRNPKTWYLLNVTPTVPIEFKKVHYTKVDPKDVSKMFKPGMHVSAKLDGAAAFLKLLKNKIEVISYRANKEGLPIMHTERVFGTIPKLDIPKEYIGSVLRGELYGTQKTDAGEEEIIPARELGGLLNSTVAKSLADQKARKIKIKMILFNIMGDDRPYSEKIKALQNIVKFLPPNISVAKQITEPEKMQELFDQIREGKHLQTREGIVLTNEAGKSYKSKFYNPYRVWIKAITEGDKRLKGVGAGGFEYSLSPDGEIVGNVGTGFTEEMRRDMLEHPEEWIGRMAEIHSEEQFPSGAYRAPSFQQLHESYTSY